ncbi:VOC family protein [Jeongeupia wiesaeckerbachi]|uniref:bleomycin resistance protein n=1 Tax=Jeongeupia wiesaeckerbachi TaxID=3051218 RepID=UPI003D8085CE
MNGRITATVPVLASLDIAESAAYYQTLGFAVTLQLPDYLIVVRDGCELHFWPCDEKHIAENTSCYIRSDDVDALHAEFVARGVRHRPPVSQPWGMKELYVIDPHGNLLKFGEMIAEG